MRWTSTQADFICDMGIMTAEPYALIVENDEGVRLDTWLVSRLTSFSRARMTELIKQGLVLVNQKPSKAAYRVHVGDQILVQPPEPEPALLEPVPMALDIIYEDEYFLAINKPPGVVVHPGAGHRQDTLVSGLIHYTKNLSLVGGVERPGLVHRLDKDTSGVLLVAKSDEVHWRLGELFKSRKIEKEYQALVWGKPAHDQGMIEVGLQRSPTNRQKFVASSNGKPAATRYWVQEDFGICSLLRLQLLTGRTHQARVHLQFLGNPVVGDPVYGSGKRNFSAGSRQLMLIGQKLLAMVKRQLLHAALLRFEHPWTGAILSITAPLPEDFMQVLTFLRTAGKNGF